MKISFDTRGSFKKTDDFLKKMSKGSAIFRVLDSYGRTGTDALASATPIDSSESAASWYHEVVESKGTYSIVWRNGNVVDGIPVVILLQYGHGTRNGGFIQGRDFINPALKPLFDRLADEVWREVQSA